jgi:hypothetical protein
LQLSFSCSWTGRRREGLSDEGLSDDLNKGIMPKVYFYHLRILATLVLLFPVRE